jgi:hypothetical protein
MADPNSLKSMTTVVEYSILRATGAPCVAT